MLTTADILEAITGIRLEQILENPDTPDSTGYYPQALLNHPITGGLIDSREVYGGALFVALQGENVDGHDFVSDAFECGAFLALIQHEVPGDLPTIDLRDPVTADSLRRMLTGDEDYFLFCLCAGCSAIKKSGKQK